ncbi:inactive serine/threonine-protein kinase VRK3 isoform X2 [Tyto alba]|uniref:inactive serine/threonine-protein kinase VRK3 isoform X2 n=1 Tax=Tyto alba TaxID=56313 RepID=UPI001C6632C1|nr:inactive serine/threonine-protein kinase VRK3 isoform X2 [Tyto alba]
MPGGGRRGRGRRQAAEPEPEPECASPRVSRFCPQCGRGVEPAFRFCPACGERLPPPPQEEGTGQTAPAPAPPPPQQQQARSPAAPARPSSRSPRKARPGPAVPLPAEAVLTDRGSGQWRLLRLLEQGGCGLMYEAQSVSGTCPQKQRYSLKLDVKDGKIYNEQNFFQRAAKAGSVQKWKKWHSVPFLGIPNCVGFGLHADSYRFLVFSDLGRTLQSVLNDGLQLLREKAAFQIVVRLLDCLEYIHENEYVHGDITAENIYLNPTDLTQVTLAGYCYAFRYCPGGKHVAQREGSRTPHEGTMEFISLDSHKGAGPSRRSDLESLGYCLLKWLCGFLPWSDDLDKVETVVEKKEKYRGDVKCLLRLCFRQRSIPDALQSYLQQVMALQYEEKPDYEALRQLFKKALEKMKASAYDSVDIKMVP